MAWTYATRTLRLPPARNPPLLCRRRCLHGREGSGLAAAWPHVHAGPRPPRSEIPPTCLLWKKAKGGREREEVRWEEIRKKREINKMMSSAPDATSKFFNPSRSCVQTF